jgi:hypothetical protein
MHRIRATGDFQVAATHAAPNEAAPKPTHQDVDLNL